MKPFLFVLLAASLLANVALVVLSRRSDVTPARIPAADPALAGPEAVAAPGPGQAATIVAVNRSGTPAAAATTPAFSWPTTTQTDQDLQRVVAGLRTAGYPATVIRAVVNQLLNERFAARSPNAGQPFWKRNGAPDPETMAAQTALNHERQALFETLMGPDARPSAMMDSDTKDRRYGALPDDKIDAIARIERDYGEMSAEAWAKRRGNAVTNSQEIMQTQQLMEKEKLADLAAVLSPEELAQYEMRNSPSARQLINNLRNVEVSESEYARLYQAQKAFDAANPRQGVLDASTTARRQAAQQALNEQARALLGDDRFYSYLEGADYQYASVARALAAAPGVTPAATYGVYRLQAELQGRLSQVARDGMPSPEKIEEMRTTMESYHSQLVALIGAPAAEVYTKQGPGRVFTASRTMLRPPSAPGTPAAVPASSLVPIGK